MKWILLERERILLVFHVWFSDIHLISALWMLRGMLDIFKISLRGIRCQKYFSHIPIFLQNGSLFLTHSTSIALPVFLRDDGKEMSKIILSFCTQGKSWQITWINIVWAFRHVREYYLLQSPPLDSLIIKHNFTLCLFFIIKRERIFL